MEYVKLLPSDVFNREKTKEYGEIWKVSCEKSLYDWLELKSLDSKEYKIAVRKNEVQKIEYVKLKRINLSMHKIKEEHGEVWKVETISPVVENGKIVDYYTTLLSIDGKNKKISTWYNEIESTNIETCMDYLLDTYVNLSYCPRSEDEKPEKSKKPEIGIKPRWLFLEHRIDELCKCLARKSKERDVDFLVEVSEELIDRLEEYKEVKGE